MPVEVLSSSFPTQEQIEDAVLERLNSFGGGYSMSDITDIIVLSHHSPEDLTMRGVGFGGWSE